MAIPVLPREGGLMLAIPVGFLADDVVTDGAVMPEEGALVGPSREFTSNLIEEDDDGNEAMVGETQGFLVVDFLDGVLEMLRDYDPVIDPTGAVEPFSKIHFAAIVKVSEATEKVKQWIAALGETTRLNFYSAREEPQLPKAAVKKAAAKKVSNAILAERVETLTSQLQLLAAQNKAIIEAQVAKSATPVPGPSGGIPMPASLPPVSAAMGGQVALGVEKASALVGPPPRTKQAPVQTPVARTQMLEQMGIAQPIEDGTVGGQVVGQEVSSALLQQSTAITALVAHLAADGLDLSNPASGSSGMATRGVAKREKMQRDLAEGDSQFFLQMQQQTYRRMNPGRPIPKTEVELQQAGTTMTAYLERSGGYRGNREAALVMWMVAHAVDAAAVGDVHMTREYLALLAVSMEQSVMDGGWSIAYLLSLMEEPPVQLYSDRPSNMTALGRPFSGLVPAPWASTALAYMKEMEVMVSRKQDSKASPKAKSAAETPSPPSPKKRPKFPKKPKAGGDSAPSA
eukprot:Skav201173  [mRNA]  locus=scaffold65:778929:780470:- [translate_table: standard]